MFTGVQKSVEKALEIFKRQTVEGDWGSVQFFFLIEQTVIILVLYLIESYPRCAEKPF